MCKISGILMLLLMALLVSLPAAAGVLRVPDSLIVMAGKEIKIVVEEEVTVYNGEMLAITAAPTIPEVMRSHILIIADAGTEADYIVEAAIMAAGLKDATAGGIRLDAGGLWAGPQNAGV